MPFPLPRPFTAPDRSTLGADIGAGLTVAAMLVPQAMAYALLAGLPPQAGLYASTVPLVLYALIGTSRQLAVGPVAIVSLLTATAIAPVAAEGTTGYLTAAATLALLVGAIHLVMGVGRLGFLVRLLSHPVLVGFTAAAAIIIGTSQLTTLLGVSVPRSEHLHDTLWDLAGAVPDAHLLTLAVGLGAVGVMVGLKRWLPLVPAALSAVAITTVVSVVVDLPARGVSVVGDIPGGLPALTVPSDLGLVATLLPAAFVITLVGFMESIAVGTVYARRNRYELDSNRELLGLGAANIGAGLTGGYPVTGGFSRTAVNAEAGATTRLAGVVTAGIVALVLALFTPLFTQLPSATLAAIVLVAVVKLVDVTEMRHVRSIKTSDALTMAIAFVATLVLGIELGIAAAVGASFVVVAARMMTPHTAVLGRLRGTDLYRNVERFAEAQRVPGVEIIRFDVSLSYLNVAFLKRRVARLLAEAPGPVEALVIDASGVNDIDTSAVEALTELIDELDRRGTTTHLANVKGPVRDVLLRSGLYQSLGDRIHHQVGDAVESIHHTPPASAP
ncbi:MAG: SulP family inorganic anion transporter [Acidimicrobiales bacterium]